MLAEKLKSGPGKSNGIRNRKGPRPGEKLPQAKKEIKSFGPVGNILSLVFPPLYGKSLGIFYQQLETQLSSGMDVVSIFRNFSKMTHSKRQAQIYLEISLSIVSGGTLSKGMDKFPLVFPKWHRAMVRAGEMTGKLTNVLPVLAKDCEHRAQTLLQFLQLLMYPIFMVHATIFLGPIAGFIAGKMTGGEYAAAVLTPLLTIYFILFCIYVWRRIQLITPTQVDFLGALLLSIPFISGIVRKQAVSRFAQILGSTLASGVPLHQSLSLAGEACGLHEIEKASQKISASVQSGRTLHDSFAPHKILTNDLLMAIGVGEKSGRLDRTLADIAKRYNAEAESGMKTLAFFIARFIEIAIFITIGKGIFTSYSNQGKVLDSMPF